MSPKNGAVVTVPSVQRRQRKEGSDRRLVLLCCRQRLCRLCPVASWLVLLARDMRSSKGTVTMIWLSRCRLGSVHSTPKGVNYGSGRNVISRNLQYGSCIPSKWYNLDTKMSLSASPEQISTVNKHIVPLALQNADHYEPPIFIRRNVWSHSSLYHSYMHPLTLIRPTLRSEKPLLLTTKRAD